MSIKNVSSLGLLAGIATLGLGALVATPAQAVPPGYTLNWSEEFNQAAGTAPNPATWGYDLGGGGWGNGELETYVNDLQHAHVVVDKGGTDGKVLEIRITKDADGKYRSARLLSNNKVNTQYGYVEARIRLPYGQGIWPAFWMMGEDIDSVSWPACGEIDVMENIGKEPGMVHGTLHMPGASGGNGLSSTYDFPTKSNRDTYHTFGILWEPNKITFYADGVPYKTRTPADMPNGATWAFNKPFFFLLNCAVGGFWPGNPDATTVFPQTMHIDYVRVYKPSTNTRR